MSWIWQRSGWPDFTWSQAELKPLEARFRDDAGRRNGAWRRLGEDEQVELRIAWLSDEAAETLGISVTRIRQAAFLVCAFATASFVALTGVIGFIGLMVPHLARGVVGPLHGAMMLTSAVIGACLLLSSDIAARTLLAPQELPIGVLTTSVGAIFVLVLVHRQK